MRIAHITDLHFQRLDRASWHDLIGKRAIGAFNLRILGRDRHFDERVAQCAVRSIAELKPDFLTITGDLSALALDSEFDAALHALSPLLESIPSLIIPGNHDIYTKDSRARFEAKFGKWMGQKFTSGLQACTFGDVMFIGMDCCRPTMIGSRGLVPYSQIHQLNNILAKETDKRIVLLTHYPVVDHDGRAYHKKHVWHSIENGKDLLAILSRSRRKPCMMLHGHAHEGFSAQFEGIPVYNPGSGGRSFASGVRQSAFNIYELDDDNSHPTMTRYVHDGFEFVEDSGPSVFSSKLNSKASDPSSYSARSRSD